MVAVHPIKCLDATAETVGVTLALLERDNINNRSIRRPIEIIASDLCETLTSVRWQ